MTFVLGKLIQISFGIAQANPAFEPATEYTIWFGIVIGLIIIYEAILRMIITRRDFQKLQRRQKLEELDSLIYKIDEYVKRGEWSQAQQLYSDIEVFGIDQMELIFRCLELAEKHERIGDLEASQFWYEKVG
ncbi:TPA: hypothetical protein EYP66_07020 [Candidatus Poribacteria bacterium]|nr:hypothetical protein [Candidatus Poribacteria bacterium]